MFGQAAGKLDDTGFIRNAQQGAADGGRSTISHEGACVQDKRVENNNAPRSGGVTFNKSVKLQFLAQRATVETEYIRRPCLVAVGVLEYSLQQRGFDFA